MSRPAALVLVLALAGAIMPAEAFAQLTPPAGTPGAGNSAISGIPFSSANPSVLSDPSGFGNASRMPPLGTNAPAPPTSYGSLNSSPPAPSRSRVVTPSYASEGSRFSAQSVKPETPTNHRRGRTKTSTFTGICSGC
jgi:hypothetical protein